MDGASFYLQLYSDSLYKQGRTDLVEQRLTRDDSVAPHRQPALVAARCGSVSHSKCNRNVVLALKELESRLAPAHLIFVNQPQNTAAGRTMAPITVSSNSTAPITLSLSNNQYGLQLQGAVTQNLVNGKAPFNNLTLAGSGSDAGKNLVLMAQSGVDVAASAAFAVKPGAANLYISPLSTTTAGNS